jgi:hypothetical protein
MNNLLLLPLAGVVVTILSSANGVIGFAPQVQFMTIRSARQHQCRSVRDVKFSRCCGLALAVEGDFDPNALSKAREEALSGSIRAKVRALYKFTRPHTIRGTILASVAGTIRALIDTPGSIARAQWSVMLPRAFIGMFALLLGNAFIVGINQIFDKEIDVLNKPFLPVASGEMSKRFAWVAVALSAITGPTLV